MVTCLVKVAISEHFTVNQEKSFDGSTKLDLNFEPPIFEGADTASTYAVLPYYLYAFSQIS
jgi:hypothetical protein